MFKCHEAVSYLQVSYLQPFIPPKTFCLFFSLTRGCSEGLVVSFYFFFKYHAVASYLQPTT